MYLIWIGGVFPLILHRNPLNKCGATFILVELRVQPKVSFSNFAIVVSHQSISKHVMNYSEEVTQVPLSHQEHHPNFFLCCKLIA